MSLFVGWRGYRAVLSARFRTLLQYRAAALAGMSTQVFWGLIRVMIFDAFYRSTTQAQPIDQTQIVTYMWLGQAMLGVLPWGVDSEIRGLINTGSVAYELLRPLDLYNLWYCRSLAARTAPTLLRSIPIFVIAGLFMGLQPPPSLLCGLGWVLTTGGAILLASAITTLINISLLWTISGDGMLRLMPTLVYVFSGLLVPLPLLPDGLRAVLEFLPFRGIVDTPFRVYLGHIPPSQIGFVFAHQIAWTLALVLFGRLLLARGARRLVVQGG
jgi:ABC-2 type transport system permease protein